MEGLYQEHRYLMTLMAKSNGRAISESDGLFGGIKRNRVSCGQSWAHWTMCHLESHYLYVA